MLARTNGSIVAMGLCGLVASCVGSGRHSTTIRAENDDLPFGGDRDRHYSQGLRIDYGVEFDHAPSCVQSLARGIEWPDLGFLDTRSSGVERVHDVGGFLGQHMYTPDDITDPDRIPDDRPYTGWLYLGLRSSTTVLGDAERRNDSQTTVELSIGTTGQPSFAEDVQTWWHDIVDADPPKGWDHQVDGEPTIQLSSQHSRRVLYSVSDAHLGADGSLRGGYNLGNFFTNASLGGTLRVGFNVPRDFTLPYIGNEQKIVPDAAPLVRVSEAPGWSLYGFAGFDGRAVLHNLSLDGNTFWGGPSVDREPFVGDFVLGAVLCICGVELGYSNTVRTSEFEEQDDSHSFSSIFLRLSLVD